MQSDITTEGEKEINSKSSTAVDYENEALDTRCGYTASCKPKGLQKFASPKAFLVLITTYAMVQGFTANGINSVNTPVYERRFQLTSQQSSLVSSVYDICGGLTVIFVGYFGGPGHQPRILGSAAIALALGTSIMTLAHFTSDPYSPSDDGFLDICVIDGNSTSTCDSSTPTNVSNYIYVLILGQLINGYSASVLFSLGITYMDQSVPAKVSALYVGIMVAGSILGPSLGFVVGGAFLNYYVDIPLPPPDSLTVKHPAWVGAWWLGFVVSALLSLCIAMFMFCFPKELPGTADLRASKVSQAHNDGTEEMVNRRTDFGMSWRDMPMATWYLLKNPVFMCISFGGAIEFILISGSSTFLPKIIANQFNVTAFTSSILTGAVAIPAAVIGQIVGGYICKRMDLKVVGMLRLALISTLCSFILSPVFLTRCADARLAGVHAAYPGTPLPDLLAANLTSVCNEGCGCTTALYNPVCADSIQYFSPCHAGCTDVPLTTESGTEVYLNCSCPDSLLTGQTTANSTVVTPGICDVNCNLLYYVFLPIVFIQFFFTWIGSTPTTISTLRVVPDKQRVFALSVNWVFIRLLGSIPGPIIFGLMIDASCSLWQYDCGERGSCWVYDNAWLSYWLMIVIVIFKSLSLFVNILALKLYKPQSQIEDNNFKKLNETVTPNESTSNIDSNAQSSDSADTHL